MDLRLASPVSFCTVRGRTIFLNTLLDRYFALASQDEDFLRRLVDAAKPRPLPSIVRRLRAIGVLAELDDIGRPLAATVCPVPSASLLDLTDPHDLPRPATLIEVSYRLLTVRRALTSGRLHALLERLRASRDLLAPDAPIDTPADIAQVARFLAARRFAPTQPTCLLDTLALAGFLARRNRPATLVIGVKIDPFGAHCWLQSDAMILNDSAENAAAFTPILAI